MPSLSLSSLLTLLLLTTLTTATPNHAAPRNRPHHASIIARRSDAAAAASANPGPEDLYAAALKREQDQQQGPAMVKVMKKKNADGTPNKRAATCKIRNGNAVAVGGTTSGSTTGSVSTTSTGTSASVSGASKTAYPAGATTASSTKHGHRTTSSTAPAWTPETTTTSTWVATTSNSASASASVSVSASAGANLGGAVSGLLSMSNSPCGPCPSSQQFPNGAQWWLNCGIDSTGWAPPNIQLSQVISKDLSQVLGGVFSPCASVAWAFEAVGTQTGVPAIMLASFAMGESTCNPNAQGKNGEIGLMQITPANCPSGANCWDVYTNILTGANLFKSMLSSYGGNVLLTIGAYNGWQQGQTVSSVNSAAVCTQRQNLDYVHDFLNGWLQGIDGNSLSTYHNLASC